MLINEETEFAEWKDSQTKSLSLNYQEEYQTDIRIFLPRLGMFSFL